MDPRSVAGKKSEDQLKAEFRARLQFALNASGMRQVELAAHVSARPHTVWRWMHGGAMPNADNMLRISQALRVSPQWLRHGTGQGPSSEPAQPAARHSSVVAAPPAPSSLTVEQQRAYLDGVDAHPLVRAAWQLHMAGRGLYQQITQTYLAVFCERAEDSRARGSGADEIEAMAGSHALNAALDERARLKRQR